MAIRKIWDDTKQDWVVVNSSTVIEVKQIKYFTRGLLLKTVRRSFGTADINIRVVTMVEV